MENLEKQKIKAVNYWRGLPLSNKHKRSDEFVDIKHFLIVLFYFRFNMNYFEIQDFFRFKNHSTCINAVNRVFILWESQDKKFLKNTEQIRKMFPISLDKEVLNDFRGLSKKVVVPLNPQAIAKLKAIQKNHDFISMQTTLTYIINNFTDEVK